MKETLKEEVLVQVELDVLFGFENEEEIFEGICDMFYDEEDLDEIWLQQVIHERYQQHQKDSLSWEKPTDFDKLAQTFDALIAEKIVCLHKAGYTKQDSESDCNEAMEILKQEFAIEAIGFCYYHTQDLERAFCHEMKNLYIGFDSATGDDNEALSIARKIISELQNNGFEVEWAGSIEQRIEIKNISWQKVPDDEDWGIDRVIQILDV